MSGAEVAEYLDWDSRFFGVRVARVRSSLADVGCASRVLAWCEQERIDVAYYLGVAGDAASTALAQEQGFRMVDVRVTLERGLGSPGSTTAATPAIRPAAGGDLSALKAIAASSHRDTRFHADARFPRALCSKLYETWIENSCNGWADRVLVATVDGFAAGYITCHLRANAVGEIGLIAVDQRHRGRGLGRSLVAAAQSFFAEHRVRHCTVATQGHNVKALRLYEHSGFRTAAVSLWFHRWFEPRAGRPA